MVRIGSRLGIGLGVVKITIKVMVKGRVKIRVRAGIESHFAAFYSIELKTEHFIRTWKVTFCVTMRCLLM